VVYEQIARTLVAAGVECLFGYMGDDTAPVIVAAEDGGVRYYATRHENQAVAMADGYARASGRVGVATVTGGPGFTNALTAINTARRGGAGLVVLAGAGRPGEDDHDPGVIRDVGIAGWQKHFPQAAVCRAMGVEVFAPATGAAAAGDVHAALWHARDGRTIVVVLGRELVLEPLQASEARALDPPAAPVMPSPQAVTELADLLEETWVVERLLILAGRGAVRAGAGAELRRLGELTGALLATTLRARSLFAGDEFAVGICGTLSTSVASELIAKARCVLAFGASLNRHTTDHYRLLPEALVVQIDSDGRALGRFVDVALSIEADARSTARALVAELERRGHGATGFRTPETEALLAGDTAEHFADASTGELIDPRVLMRELDSIIPPDRIVALDSGNQVRFALRQFGVERPEDFVQSTDGGSIGLGVGFAMGAAAANPGRLVVLAVGDAALMMALGDLETAVRYELPLLIVVANDGAMGSEVNRLLALGLPPERAELPAPAFAALAEAMGADGLTVRSAADLAEVGRRLESGLHGPLVLDCRVNPAVKY
jgi:thiamine pyrophosphate-dependent acetolactate synthase large subunit-like protein